MLDTLIENEKIRSELGHGQHTAVQQQTHFHIRRVAPVSAHDCQDDILVRSALAYAAKHNANLGPRLGFGIHGIVFAVESNV